MDEAYRRKRTEIDDAFEDDFQRLWAQSERVLDRHAEVQRNQRQQATRSLQLYAAGTGAVVAGLSGAYRFAPELAFGRSVGVGQQILGGVAGVVGFLALLSVVGLLYNVPITVVDVLSPKPIVRRPVTGGWRRGPTEARGGVQTVSTAKFLQEATPNGGSDPGTTILADRLTRIDRNEAVIDYNARELRRIYQRFTLMLELAFVGSLASLVTLVALFRIP